MHDFSATTAWETMNMRHVPTMDGHTLLLNRIGQFIMKKLIFLQCVNTCLFSRKIRHLCLVIRRSPYKMAIRQHRATMVTIQTLLLLLMFRTQLNKLLRP